MAYMIKWTAINNNIMHIDHICYDYNHNLYATFRSGDNYYIYQSTDGVNFTQVFSTTVSGAGDWVTISSDTTNIRIFAATANGYYTYYDGTSWAALTLSSDLSAYNWSDAITITLGPIQYTHRGAVMVKDTAVAYSASGTYYYVTAMTHPAFNDACYYSKSTNTAYRYYPSGSNDATFWRHCFGVDNSNVYYSRDPVNAWTVRSSDIGGHFIEAIHDRLVLDSLGTGFDKISLDYGLTWQNLSIK